MKIKEFKLNNKGFSLVELFFAISIMVILFFMAGDYIRTGLESSRIDEEQEEAIKNSRNSLDVLTQELRKAKQSDRGDFVFNTTEPQNIIFYSDIDNDEITEQVRYHLINRDLIKNISKPTGTPLSYSNPIRSTTTISKYINNIGERIFTYLDTNGATTTNINSIRLIKIHLITNVNPLILPGDYIMDTKVHIRNLKDNL